VKGFFAVVSSFEKENTGTACTNTVTS